MQCKQGCNNKNLTLIIPCGTEMLFSCKHRYNIHNTRKYINNTNLLCFTLLELWTTFCFHYINIELTFELLPLREANKLKSSASSSWWVSSCHNTASVSHFLGEVNPTEKSSSSTRIPPLRAPNTILPNKEKSGSISSKKIPVQKSGSLWVCSERPEHSYVITETQQQRKR